MVALCEGGRQDKHRRFVLKSNLDGLASMTSEKHHMWVSMKINNSLTADVTLHADNGNCSSPKEFETRQTYRSET